MSYRIKQLSISGFRGFGRSVDLDLDGDVIILSGVNGSGKTSLMDSILWVLTGSIARLGNAPEIVSRYSSAGEARVEAVLESSGGSRMRVVRRHDGKDTSLSLQVDNLDAVRGPSAEGALLEALWPDAQLAQDPSGALVRSLTRAVYLQQDSVREFVEADGEEERFRAVGEIVGAGRAGELSSQLASARNRWSRGTTAVEKEADPSRARLAQLKARAATLDEADLDTDALNTAWQTWLRRAGSILGEATDGGDRSRHLDRTLTTLRAEEGRLQRAAESLESLRHALGNPIEEPVGLEAQETELLAVRVAVEASAARLEAVQSSAAEERRRALESTEIAQQLAAMAAIALGHLDGGCPVCGQDHDESTTRARLNAYIDAAGSDQEIRSFSDDVARAASDVQQLERDERLLADSVRDLSAQRERRSQWLARVARLAAEAELPEEGLTPAGVGDLLESTLGRAAEVSSLRRSGEQLGLSLARLDEQSQRAALQSQMHELELEVARFDAQLAERAETAELATQIIDGLRTASEEIVKEELVAMEPLLQRIYSSVDPHPSFRVVSFLTRTIRGKGRLWTPIADVDASQSVDEPSSVLSSSQLNVLAVSTFLSLNLSVESLPLEMVALDDPLQSLDDVNLLGLADLIRRVRGRRQVIISTHDDRLSGLLRRKLRPVHPGERTLTVELAGWTRSGPTTEVSEVSPDVSGLRLVG